jgi:hypothetical protein
MAVEHLKPYLTARHRTTRRRWRVPASAVVIGVITVTTVLAPGDSGAASTAPAVLNQPANASAVARRIFTGGSTFGGCAIFPPNYLYNTPIGSFPVRPESAAVIAHSNALGGRSTLQFGFWSEPTSGFQPIVVPASQPLVPITYDQYGDFSDPGPFPIPLNAPQESNSDTHIIVVQQGTCALYELWATHRSSNGWYAGTGAQWNLGISDSQPMGWPSADSAGLPILPGLLRYDEVASGRINHALRIIVNQTRRAVIAPATHLVGNNDSLLLPFGARLRLRADYDISGFTGQSRVIAEALKNYGVIVADNGPNWMISGEGDSRWDDHDMDQIRALPASAFEYVDSGPVITG